MSMTNFGVGAAFMAGVFSLFSPCVLPLLPVYFSILAGSGAYSDGYIKKRVLLINTCSFVLGFTAIFVLLGLTITAAGRFLLIYRELLVKIGGIFVVLFGMFLLGIIKIPALMREHRRQMQVSKMTPPSAFLLGCAFSLGWTPCIGPILSSVLFMAGSSQNFKVGALLLFLFSLGMGLPFITLAVAVDHASGWIKSYRTYLPITQKIAGGLLIVMGILLYMNRL